MSLYPEALAQSKMEEILAILDKIKRAENCKVEEGIATEMKTAFLLNLHERKERLADEVANLVLLEEWAPVNYQKVKFALDCAGHTGSARLDNRTWNALQMFTGSKFKFLPMFFHQFLDRSKYYPGLNTQHDEWFKFAKNEVAEYREMMQDLPKKRLEHWHKLVRKFA